VRVAHVELVDFRNYHQASVDLDSGLTVVRGANGQGKTNLVEALGYLATLESFRGSPPDALVRNGSDVAVVRAVVEQVDGRVVTIDAEIQRTGRDRVLVNRQRLARARDLLGAVRVSLFSPDDLAMVKEGPAGRRRYLDDVLVALHPRYDRLRRDLDRVLRQRNVLLKQAGGRAGAEVLSTLDVWDAKFAVLGDDLGASRADLVARLGPRVARAYADLTGSGDDPIRLSYAPLWRAGGLATALSHSRAEDIRRQITLVGPHRDELDLTLGSMPVRTHASQGEQRGVALALRLGAHGLVTEQVGSAPVLLLDDVFSELDADRSAALLRHLPQGQVVLTTAGELPAGAHPDRILEVRDGAVVAG
jgi:DNA replication and repair protein RecF